MNISEIHTLLLEHFSEAVVGAAFHESVDPWIEVPADSIWM
jgi:hypothetical protein